MFSRSFKIFCLMLSFMYGSSIFGADLLGAKKYGANDTLNHVSAKVLKANQIAVSTSYFYLSKPNISLIDGTYNTLSMKSASLIDTNVGYGIADIVELDLGVHFSYEQMDQEIRSILVDRTDEKAQSSLANTYPKDFDFSAVSGTLKVQVLDFSIYKLAISGIIESSGKDSSSYTVSRSSSLSGGWILSNEFDLGRHVELGLNIGDIYTHSQQLGDYKVADRMIVQGLGKVKATDSLSFFVGSEYKHIKLNTSYSITANAYTGIELQGDNFGVTTFVGRYFSESCLSYSPFSIGLTLKYISSPIRYVTDSVDEDQDEVAVNNTKEVKKNTKDNSKVVAKNDKDQRPRFTQKDGVFYDDNGDPINVQESLKKEFVDDRDEFYDYDRRIQASAQGEQVDPAVLTERYYQEELAKARAEKELQYKQEVRKQQLAEIQRKKELKKRVEEEDRLERKYRDHEFDELNDLPEITDDEINWNGLR